MVKSSINFNNLLDFEALGRQLSGKPPYAPCSLGKNDVTRAQQIAQNARSQIDENCQVISQEVGQILSHVVSNELMNQSVHQLQDLIREAFVDGQMAQVRIEGPQVLVDKIQDAFGDDFAKIDVNTRENTELSVEIDQTLMVTKLNDWRQIFGDNV